MRNHFAFLKPKSSGWVLGLGVLGLSALPLQAEEMDAGDMIDIPLEQLMQMDATVNTVSKQNDTVANSPAAIFVISAEDIRRAGATSIPEALAMAPGIQVGRIGSNEWGVSSRGLGGRFARYLLVLVDGRSVYTSFFSGVNWDEQNLLLDDIERIEVVRGPGGSIWGANAVNGVVNIITKTANNTQGTETVAEVGDVLEKYFAYARHGGELGNGYFRFSAGARGHGEMEAKNLSIEDRKWRDRRVSFNYHQGDEGRSFTLDAQYANIRSNTLWPEYLLQPPYQQVIDPDEENSNYHIQGLWKNSASDTQHLTLRMSHDKSDRQSGALDWRSQNVDIDLEYASSPMDRHSVIMGMNVRTSKSVFYPKRAFSVDISPAVETTTRYSIFIQDQIQLSEKLQTIVGGRLDAYSNVGRAFQPTARLVFNLDDKNVLWSSVTRAESVPSRITTNRSLTEITTLPPTTESLNLPTVIRLENRETLRNAKLTSYEAGFRTSVIENIEVDFTLFHHEYTDLLAVGDDLDTDVYLFDAEPRVEVTLPFITQNNPVTLDGAELSLRWQPREDVYAQYSGSYFSDDDTNIQGALSESSFGVANSVPEHQHSLRIFWDINSKISFDVWYRYLAKYPNTTIDRQSNMDLRIEWKVNPKLRLSLSGKNLLDEETVQYTREVFYIDDFVVPTYWVARVQASF